METIKVISKKDLINYYKKHPAGSSFEKSRENFYLDMYDNPLIDALYLPNQVTIPLAYLYSNKSAVGPPKKEIEQIAQFFLRKVLGKKQHIQKI